MYVKRVRKTTNIFYIRRACKNQMINYGYNLCVVVSVEIAVKLET